MLLTTKTSITATVAKEVCIQVLIIHICMYLTGCPPCPRLVVQVVGTQAHRTLDTACGSCGPSLAAAEILR